VHAFTSTLVHIVFATKNREASLPAEIQSRLCQYLGGIARANKMKALAVGGGADHLHVLVGIPPTLTVSKVVQILKGNSSKWLNETFPEHGRFAWQEGYGAFSVGISAVDDTVRYIVKQAEHHRKRTFRDELELMLKRHGLKFDQRSIG
jgi:putative transposase